MVTPVIFIIDENRIYRKLIQEYIKIADYPHIYTFHHPDACFQYEGHKPDLIITEFKFARKQIQGLYLLKLLQKQYPHTKVIFLTSNSDVETAINAVRSGAFDYIIKSKIAPFKLVNRIKSAVNFKNSDRRNLTISRTLIASAGILLVLMVCLIFLYTH